MNGWMYDAMCECESICRRNNDGDDGHGGRYLPRYV